MTFDQWLQAGIAGAWCGPPVCQTHDGTPTTAAEDDEYDDGGEPCIHILRLYPDTATRDAVTTNHPPTQWRQRGAGL